MRNIVKCKVFAWTDYHSQAFKKLKEAVNNAVQLAFPIPGAPLTITTYASGHAIGACLHQLNNGENEPLSFFSRTLTDVESRYSTFDRELLAIFAATKKWKHFLHGSTVTVFTDHKPIVGAIKNTKERDSDRQQRQISFILEYVSDVLFIAGKQNVVADALSRPEIAAINSLQNTACDNTLVDLISIAKEQVNCNQNFDNLTSFKISDYNLYCDTSSPNPRPFVPEKFRFPIFKLLHELSHPGWKSTCRIVGSRYFWPSLKDDIKQWSHECQACQSSKVGRHTKLPLGELPFPSQRFTRVHIDIVGPLEPSTTSPTRNLRYLITMVDSHTRWLEAVPVGEITAEIVCKTFMYHWVARFGPPLYLISDRGTQFHSELLKNLNELLGINQIRTCAYNPKANGMVERAHRSLKSSLMARSGNWDDKLPIVLFSLKMRPDT